MICGHFHPQKMWLLNVCVCSSWKLMRQIGKMDTRLWVSVSFLLPFKLLFEVLMSVLIDWISELSSLSADMSLFPDPKGKADSGQWTSSPLAMGGISASTLSRRDQPWFWNGIIAWWLWYILQCSFEDVLSDFTHLDCNELIPDLALSFCGDAYSSCITPVHSRQGFPGADEVVGWFDLIKVNCIFFL